MAKVPTSIGIPANAPTDIMQVGQLFTGLVSALQNWIAQVATALNNVISSGTVPSGGTTHQVLHGPGGSTTWSPVDLTADVTNILPVGSGGSGSNFFTNGAILIGQASFQFTTLPLGTSTQVLHGNAGGAATWGQVSLTADVTGTLPLANGGTGITNAAVGPAGQLPGEPSNGSASAGNVGEFVTSTVASPGTSLTTGTPANVTSISLSPGDWDVRAQIFFLQGAANTAQFAFAGINTTSATLPSATGGGEGVLQLPLGTSASNNLHIILPVGTVRLSLSSTTTVYLVGQAAFASSTVSVYGTLSARRAR